MFLCIKNHIVRKKNSIKVLIIGRNIQIIVFALQSKYSMKSYLFAIPIKVLLNCGFAGLTFFHLYSLEIIIDLDHSIAQMSKYIFDIVLLALVIIFILGLSLSIADAFMIILSINEVHESVIIKNRYSRSVLLQSLSGVIIVPIACPKLLLLAMAPTINTRLIAEADIILNNIIVL